MGFPLRFALFVAAFLSVCLSVLAYDYQVSTNDIGDWDLLTIGGYTMAKPISVRLYYRQLDQPHEWRIRCQLVYKDREIERPKSETEFVEVSSRRAQLNEWLAAFFEENYSGLRPQVLLDLYGSGKMAEDVNALFPAYVADCMAEAGFERGIEAVTVCLEAEGEFRRALIKAAGIAVP